ncbi:hypothetical protein [Youxingia wuxianensis]|uniref:Uncharacterized protein n=1 Tax=Youxingia wuxianensis TaxID=2763678 RepID=A0A926EKN8_9FIRM|nr:hypothetical protein [Youxingia wuxianensis]MBC8584135.1 hypothetical protein [Youxingia wuxianensis]
MFEFGNSYPLAMSALLGDNDNSRDYFYSLPEEIQKKVLSANLHSEQEVYDYVNRLMEKK